MPAGSVQIANPVVCCLAESRNRPAAIARDGDSRRPSVRARICKRICGCESPPIVPSTAREPAVEVGDHRGSERVWGLSSRRVLGRVPFLHREAEPAVVQVDARRRLEQVAPEPRGVRLDERHADAVSVDDAQRGRVAGSRADTERGRVVDGDHFATRRERGRCSRARGRRPRRAAPRGGHGPPASRPRSASAARAGRRGRREGGRPAAIHALDRRR